MSLEKYVLVVVKQASESHITANHFRLFKVRLCFLIEIFVA